MANNNKKLTRAEAEAKEAKSLKRTKIFITVFAVIAIVAILVSGGVAIAMNVKHTGKAFDYYNQDLSKYVYISEDDYKNFNVTVSVEKVDDNQIENAILKILAQNKIKDPLYDGKSIKQPTITAGDVISLKYRGYTKDKDGNIIDFAGGCNFQKAEFDELEIGGGKFIPGFELALVGKNTREYAAYSEKTTGTVAKGDLIQLTYTAIYPDGRSSKDVSVMIDLGSANCDQTYGKGFADFLVGKTVGEQIKDLFTITDLNGMKGDSVYSNMKVTKVYDVKDDTLPTLTIPVTFPNNYQDKTLAGKDAFFDVYVKSGIIYDTPEFDNKFVTETLKLTEKDLKDYEGEELIDKYKNKIIADLQAEYDNNVQIVIADALWDIFMKKAEFKKLPKSEVNTFYDQYYGELKAQYQSYGQNYGSFDAFALTYLALNPGDSWEEALTKQAEESVKQKLVFNYVAQKEGFFPTDEEYDALYEKSVKEHLDQYLINVKCDRKDYKTQEEYDKAVAKHKETMMGFYDDAYFKENIYFEFALDKMCDFAKVQYK